MRRKARVGKFLGVGAGISLLATVSDFMVHTPFRFLGFVLNLPILVITSGIRALYTHPVAETLVNFLTGSFFYAILCWLFVRVVKRGKISN
jgi:hypothetical protein